ncbi:MAG: succinyl-diaminopimelate desuccinylase [Pseudomonadota bacterium]|nr:succinyl-diaminopimelate desuccinylase [Pseudomonadota bacterium]
MINIENGDPIILTKALISCRSVTPHNDGAIEQLSHWLSEMGFKCDILNFKEDGTDDVLNLWARIGNEEGPALCFAGHTDVVPEGDETRWSTDPFAANEIDGKIIGRGATDMKGAIASFVSATKKFLDERENFAGSISFIITGDEEGIAINGTKKLLNWMQENSISFDDCIVGEPTNPKRLGEMIKIGRRGSVNGVLTVDGQQGHVAYPHLAKNPIPMLLNILNNLTSDQLDQGNEHFQPSNLEITSVDVGNKATNVIPQSASARFNIRYNDNFNSETIEDEINRRLENFRNNFSLKLEHSGDSFLTKPGKLVNDLSEIIFNKTGINPDLSTSGGTSDARFIKNYGNVVEFGLISETMHQIDESVAVKDINDLSEIYYEVLKKYF